MANNNFQSRLKKIEQAVEDPPKPKIRFLTPEERECIRKVSKRFAEKLRGKHIDIHDPQALKLLQESQREVREAANGGSL